MDIKEISHILKTEYDYSDYEAEVSAHDLILLSSQLQPALSNWISSRKEMLIQVGEFSTTQLVKEKGFTYPAALIALDWIITEPEIAIPVITNDIRL